MQTFIVRNDTVDINNERILSSATCFGTIVEIISYAHRICIVIFAFVKAVVQRLRFEMRADGAFFFFFFFKWLSVAICFCWCSLSAYGGGGGGSDDDDDDDDSHLTVAVLACSCFK